MSSVKHRRHHIIKIVGIVLPAMPFTVIVGSLSFSLLQGALHLDFSQEYRQVDGAEQITFRENWQYKIYRRSFWGLRSVGKEERDIYDMQDVEKAEDEEAIFSWLDTVVYDVSESREHIVWYDWQEEKIFLGDLGGEILQAYETQDMVEQIVFSPDGKYILFCEIEYGVNGGYSTDEEYCSYRAIDIGDGAQYKVYGGYREWFKVYWE